jgi:hypothetical protein
MNIIDFQVEGNQNIINLDTFMENLLDITVKRKEK